LEDAGYLFDISKKFTGGGIECQTARKERVERIKEAIGVELERER
jgi:hypothetical protein